MKHTDDYGQPIKAYDGNMYYCVHKITKSLVSASRFGGIETCSNPNDMSFLIKGAWEDRLKYREDKGDFEIKKFSI